jgi:hypothetical protein
MLRLLHIDEPQVCFVNQRRSLQCLARILLGKFLRRELPQFVVDERQKLLGGGRIALLDGRQDSCDFSHYRRAYPLKWMLTIGSRRTLLRAPVSSPEVCRTRAHQCAAVTMAKFRTAHLGRLRLSTRNPLFPASQTSYRYQREICFG